MHFHSNEHTALQLVQVGGRGLSVNVMSLLVPFWRTKRSTSVSNKNILRRIWCRSTVKNWRSSKVEPSLWQWISFSTAHEQWRRGPQFLHPIQRQVTTCGPWSVLIFSSGFCSSGLSIWSCGASVDKRVEGIPRSNPRTWERECLKIKCSTQNPMVDPDPRWYDYWAR